MRKELNLSDEKLAVAFIAVQQSVSALELNLLNGLKAANDDESQALFLAGAITGVSEVKDMMQSAIELVDKMNSDDSDIETTDIEPELKA